MRNLADNPHLWATLWATCARTEAQRAAADPSTIRQHLSPQAGTTADLRERRLPTESTGPTTTN